MPSIGSGADNGASTTAVAGLSAGAGPLWPTLTARTAAAAAISVVVRTSKASTRSCAGSTTRWAPLHVTALDLGAAGGHRFQQRFDAVAKVADGIDAGHACATLQGHRNDPAGPCLPRRRCRPARGHTR
ncbi:hypothetical protein G6F24_014582 [Rhizopus arrhizus]|nr:hypothetical protein G6F24_014582 [Rhizopus arrhizus]